MRRGLDAVTGLTARTGTAPQRRNSAVYAVVFRQQLFFAFAKVRMLDDAVGGAYQHALRLVLGAYALGAQQRIDDLGTAGRDGLVRAGFDACVAGGAVVVDQQGHAGLL